MSSGDSLLPSAAPGLDEPLEMLHACHERMRAQLTTLTRLAQWLPEHGADEQAQRAARAVMRYFDLAAVNHHLDEEEDLLPAMLAAVEAAERGRLEALVARIRADHVSLAAHWAAVRALLTQIVEGHAAALGDEQVLHFAAAYETHIRLEEEEVLPWAERMLGAEAVVRISHRMTDRRRAPTPAAD
ncbi:MAG: hemerythrin domain-containing protein [Pseudazoarcus pumilus]|mgnify:CR=1 FL=1|nr:hemerythrin domain-containing protein [Pseudazoarcus pumilus]